MSIVMAKPGSPEAATTGSDTKVHDLPEGLFLEHTVRIAGNHNQTGGSSDPTLAEDAPFTIAQIVEVKSRKGTHIKATGPMLYHLARYDNAKAGPGDVAPTSSGPSVTGTGDKAFSFFLPLCFAPRAAKIRDALAALWVDGDKPQLSIQYGGAAQLATGGDRTLSVNSIGADLTSLKQDAVTVAPAKVRVIDEITVPITQAQVDLKVKINARVGRRTRLLLIRLRYAGARSNTPANGRFKLWLRGKLVYEGLWRDIQEETRRVLGAAPPAGIGVIDLDTTGLQADLPITDSGDCWLECDVAAPSGTTDITVLADSIVDAAAFGQQ